jgi:hypothetical protein
MFLRQMRATGMPLEQLRSYIDAREQRAAGVPEVLEVLLPHLDERSRDRLVAVWHPHYDYHRPHGAAGGQSPATRAPVAVSNVMASYG